MQGPRLTSWPEIRCDWGSAESLTRLAAAKGTKLGRKQHSGRNVLRQSLPNWKVVFIIWPNCGILNLCVCPRGVKTRGENGSQAILTVGRCREVGITWCISTSFHVILDPSHSWNSPYEWCQCAKSCAHKGPGFQSILLVVHFEAAHDETGGFRAQHGWMVESVKCDWQSLKDPCFCHSIFHGDHHYSVKYGLKVCGEGMIPALP